MIDPALALKHKAYTDADYKPVVSMTLKESSNGGLTVEYKLASTIAINGIDHPEVAKEYFQPTSNEPYQRGRYNRFIEQHIQGQQYRRMFRQYKTVPQIIKNQAMLDTPAEITHRINDKKFSIINRKKFKSGREERAS